MTFPDSYPSQTTSSFHGTDTSTFENGVRVANPFDLDAIVPEQRTEQETVEHKSSINHKQLLEDLRQTALGFAMYEDDDMKKEVLLKKADAIEQYLIESTDPSYGDFVSLSEEEINNLAKSAKKHKALGRFSHNTGNIGVPPLFIP